MSKTTRINVPMNRVEGDLEVTAEIQDGVVVDAWCAGTMFRGFENIMAGRGPLDGLVITPRVCGICSTAHLTAAALALDQISGVELPPDALRVRNLALMTEHIQSDVRHTFLMFTADLVNPRYQAIPLYDELVRRYAPFEGSTVIDVLRRTKHVLELIAIIGGQWPHSSFMVPGGVASVPSRADLLQCRHLLQQYRSWYEQRVLGCSIERWLEVQSGAALDAWLEERAEQRDGELGFLLRVMRELGLDAFGAAHDNYLSFGSLDIPADTAVAAPAGAGQLIPAGFARGSDVRAFDQASVTEHVTHSWYEDYEGGLHPSQGKTVPYASGSEGRKYSWAKAPRYEGTPAETGPLAEAMVAGDPLFTELASKGGASVYLRQLARLSRPARLIPAMEAWLIETKGEGDLYRSPGTISDGEGAGLTHAARGALGHWVRVEGGKIRHYQIITPTAWNASPRDSDGVRGPMEQALVGTPVADAANPVELGHVVRSLDPCLVCTVHAVRDGRALGRARVGAPA